LHGVVFQKLNAEATACETALWPAGTFARAYAANRRAAIESIIEADAIATCVRAIMVDRTMWTGSASDLLRFCADSERDIGRIIPEPVRPAPPPPPPPPPAPVAAPPPPPSNKVNVTIVRNGEAKEYSVRAER
jgi:hypothetical protein